MEEKIKLFICDDSVESIESIKEEIRRYPNFKRMMEISEFYNGGELLKRCSAEPPHAVFLDIDMPNLNGFEVAERLQENNKEILIVFVTSYEDRVYQSWTYQPFWFVRKSHLEDFNTVLPRLFEKLEHMKSSQDNKVKFLLKNRVVSIDLNSLMYVESCGHEISLYYVSGERERFRCKISDAENQLAPHGVLRIQKGILANVRFISRVTSREIVLTDNRSFPVSRDRTADVKTAFADYMRGL